VLNTFDALQGAMGGQLSAHRDLLSARVQLAVALGGDWSHVSGALK